MQDLCNDVLLWVIHTDWHDVSVLMILTNTLVLEDLENITFHSSKLFPFTLYHRDAFGRPRRGLRIRWPCECRRGYPLPSQRLEASRLDAISQYSHVAPVQSLRTGWRHVCPNERPCFTNCSATYTKSSGIYYKWISVRFRCQGLRNGSNAGCYSTPWRWQYVCTMSQVIFFGDPNYSSIARYS